MRDKTHMQSIERWAQFVKDNPSNWKKIHTEFIDSQFLKHEEFIKRVLDTKGGKEKLAKLYKKQ